MKKILLASLALALVASVASAALYHVIWGINGTKSQIDGAANFAQAAIDDPTLQNDAGHAQALTQMLDVIQRRYTEVLAADLSTMTDSEQLDYFNGLAGVATSMNTLYTACSTLGYAEPLATLDTMKTAYVSQTSVWTAYVTNSIVIDAMQQTGVILKTTTPS